nr:LD-carboxypeptidase [Bacteroidales bacterium]
ASGADFTDGDEDLILFIEEVEESFHAIDRYFQMLRLRGVLDHTKGVILGSFTDCKQDLGYNSAEQMLTTYLLGKGIPVCCGFPAGHDGRNVPLLMGADVTLKVYSSGSVLKFDL